MASGYALLEHADDEGDIDVDAARSAAAAGAASAGGGRPGAGRPAKPAPARAAASRPASRTPAGSAASEKGLPPVTPSTRPEDIYRAFEHVFRDPGSNEVVLRFHKTLIIRIRPNGAMRLSTGGWWTATTVAALNDGLQALGMRLSYKPPVSSGQWVLTDDAGQQLAFQEGMVLQPTKPVHSQRGAKLLSAYNGGAEVPRYVRKPAAQQPQPAPAPPAAAAGQPPGGVRISGPGVPSTAQPPAHAPARPPPPAAAPSGGQAKAASLAHLLDIEADDEHLCVVCFEALRDEVLVPCGHMVLCSACCASIRAKGNECPVCREIILDHCHVDPRA